MCALAGGDDPSLPGGWMMSIESETEVLGFRAEYDEPGPTPKPGRRHARRRLYLRTVPTMLGASLVLTVGVCVFLWFQLNAERSAYTAVSSDRADLEIRLDDAQSQLAELSEKFETSRQQVTDSEAELNDLQQRIDEADAEAAEAEERLESSAAALDDARRQAEALSSAVLGGADRLDECVRAADRVADNTVRMGRGALAQQAGATVELCESAAEFVRSAVPTANAVQSG